jgi:hypothetical protein
MTKLATGFSTRPDFSGLLHARTWALVSLDLIRRTLEAGDLCKNTFN